MQSGYGFQLDRTCYNIVYTTSDSTVTPGTYLFSFTIFIEEGRSEAIALDRTTPDIAFSGPSESAIIISSAPGQNLTYDVNAGQTVDGDPLTHGNYATTIRAFFVPPADIIIYPINIQIIGKLCLLHVNGIVSFSQ